MALSTTILETRIDDELKLLGKFTSTVKTNIVRDAVMRYCRIVDTPVINANLTVTTSKGPYAIPSTIEKLTQVYDNASTPVPAAYSKDGLKKQITFIETPTAGTYVCYGTPNSIRTNLTDVVAAIDEDHEDALWDTIRAMAHKQANSSVWTTELQNAERSLRGVRQAKNRELDMVSNAIRQKDTTGKVAADSDNAEGYDVNYNDLYESDL